MNRRTPGTTSRTCVHEPLKGVSTLRSRNVFKFLFSPFYLFSIIVLITSTFLLGEPVAISNYPEQGIVPQVDISLESPKRWKASSRGLEFIRRTLSGYIADEIANQREILNKLDKKPKHSTSLILHGKIVETEQPHS